MYQVDWWSDIEPDLLLNVIRKDMTKRELRLFACACARRIWSKFAEVAALCAAVEVAEAYVDEEASTFDLANVQSAAEESIIGIDIVETFDARSAAYACADAEITMGNLRTIAWLAAFSHSHPDDYDDQRSKETEEERVAQRHLLRDIFLDPSMTLPSKSVGDALGDETVRRLAQDLYENRTLPAGTFDPSKILELRLRLKDLGYSDPTVMNHLESPHPHVRGCWVVDLILGKRSLS